MTPNHHNSSKNHHFPYGIIGCGLIGEKRAAAIKSMGGKLVGVFDHDPARTAKFAERHVCHAFHTAEELVGDNTIRVVLVATPNHTLSAYGELALRHGKHVLLEKPGAVNAASAALLREQSQNLELQVGVGYNHRFHPAIQKAKAMIVEIGELMFLRARYGHGGRLGYDSEWRSNPQLSGGGELIDQGVHLIDLGWWFLGNLRLRHATLTTSFWNMPVEDNCFLALEDELGKKMAWLHASCSEWKNLFSLEIYGRAGKLQIEGLGGSYGPERVTFYAMSPQMGPPLSTTWEFPPSDQSWELELRAFESDIIDGGHRVPRIGHAEKILQITDQIYSSPSCKL